ncbi:MAG: GPR endopeptidase [Ruminococcus sp.]|nr:GPR endopeptidase [Ruminococcus sp.]MBQ1382147.1 GPR endopeptidase [Ruminococcus sp.]MBQ1601756.1 GPR endopeptidase [Ruminococcus sp.]MBQ1813701.1 GPR endopeptidase [Ruminococcus sp.]MBQ2357724.1 GPR endopeptidase [Ruminococcus sp.]
MQMRTDLAIEARELAGDRVAGTDYREYRENGMKISRLTVKTQRAGQLLGKDAGTYITVEMPSLTDNFTETDERIKTIGREIRRLLPVNGLLLVAGLGNEEITPDSLGPKTGARVLATRHITGELARAAGLDRLRPVAVMNTGVTGQTGIETGEYILSVVKRIRPNAVIAVDALASRRIERLGKTVQISDAGISPGAGVGNHRTRINKETIGVPVIAIGVPTVVDAQTFAGDLLSDSAVRRSAVLPDRNVRQMIVIPREIDLLTERASRLLAFSLNAAMQNAFDLRELVSLM